jgi:hypothetical protein
MRRRALLALPAAALAGLLALPLLVSGPVVSASAQDSGGAWKSSLTWPDGRELQWRSKNAPACDGSDVELRMINNSSSSGDAKLSGVTFTCSRKGEAQGPARVIGRVPAGGATSAPAIICACAEKGGVVGIAKADVEFLKDGAGTEVTTNGCSYTGNYVGGQRAGKGVYACPGGYRFEGSYSGGQPNGVGVEVMGAQKYEGEFSNGKRQGLGRMTYVDGSTYEGEFKNGLRDGTGTAVFKDGSQYVGEWKADLRNGHGTYTSTGNVWTFDGEWVNDERSGPGKTSYTDGSQIREGTYRNGRMEGEGSVAFGDGRVFRGAFVNDEQKGPGILTYKDGRKITGAFQNFVPHGAAVETGPQATIDANWVNGVLQGRATLVYATGERFEGEYLGGKRNGLGIETRRDNSKEECRWVNDVRQTPCNRVTSDGKRIEFRQPSPKARN